VAAKHPDLVGKAILEDPPWFEESQLPPAPADPGAMLEQRRAEIIERKKLSRETLMAQGREQSPTWSEVELGPWAESKRQLSPNVVGLFGKRTPWQGIVAQIACPTLLITADAENAIVTTKTAQQARELNANIRVVHIEGAGHNIRREAFEPFMQAVKAFLAES
jgi:N-formylmaleamate deformylase